jgi:hypothetical protein
LSGNSLHSVRTLPSRPDFILWADMSSSSHMKFFFQTLTAVSGHLTQIDRDCGSSEWLSEVETRWSWHFECSLVWDLYYVLPHTLHVKFE